MQKPKKRSGFSFYFILIAIILASSFFMTRLSNPGEVTLSEIEKSIEDGKVEYITMKGNDLEITLKAQGNTPAKRLSKSIHPSMIPEFHKLFRDALDAKKITAYDYNQPTDITGIISMIFTILLIGGLGFMVWMSFSQRSGDGRNAMNFGRSRARLNDPSKNKVDFNDVAGADEEKEELEEVVGFLRNPQKYTELGAKIPKGILLVGAPGTGKTLLAKAVAGEAGVPFFSISGSDFVEMFVGVGASRVRDMFDEAKKKAPCIVFIDEIDAVGRHRGAGMGGGHDEREQTLNQLLVEMDGFGPNEGVIVLAATNRPDILDPALLRPGRFDRRITVQRPDLKGREEILKVHARKKPLADDVDLSEIAKITPGFTGADLANLLNEAALLAARKDAKIITYNDISEAVFKVTMGPEKKSRVISEKERQLTAYHEAGHAVLVRAVSETDRVERVSIIPVGGAGGYTAFKPNEDLYFMSRSNLIQQIMIALGGRAAEELTQDDISTGASQDLQQCNKIARDMITKYGMSDKLSNFVTSSDDEVFLGRDYGHTRQYSEATSALIDAEVREILDEAYEATLDILKRERVFLDKLAERLLDKEKVEGPEFEELYREYAADFKPLPGGDDLHFIAELTDGGVETDDETAAESAREAKDTPAPEAADAPEASGTEDTRATDNDHDEESL